MIMQLNTNFTNKHSSLNWMASNKMLSRDMKRRVNVIKIENLQKMGVPSGCFLLIQSAGWTGGLLCKRLDREN